MVRKGQSQSKGIRGFRPEDAAQWTAEPLQLRAGPTAVKSPPPPPPGKGCVRREEKGRGVWDLFTKKWPNQIFPMVDFLFAHDGHLGLGGGGGDLIKKTDQCKPEAMHSTARHKCILILYAKPGYSSRHTLCLKQKTDHHV